MIRFLLACVRIEWYLLRRARRERRTGIPWHRDPYWHEHGL